MFAAMNLDLPPDLLGEVQSLVQAGEYPDTESAIVDLVREGLQARSARDREVPDGPDLPDPSKPGGPQGLPDDVNWM